jgi:hypothetical protein
MIYPPLNIEFPAGVALLNIRPVQGKHSMVIYDEKGITPLFLQIYTGRVPFRSDF